VSRWKAGAIHFGISVIIFLLLLSIILLVWYPGILFSIDGGWTGLRLVMGVDLVLGPLLTLIVFKAGKPGLKFDLSCIATAQIACMAAGMWIVYQERPIALVLAYDTIYSVVRQDFEDYEKDLSILDDFSGSYPKLIYIELPESDTAASIAYVRSQFIGDPLYIQTDKYRAIQSGEEDLSNVFRWEEDVRNVVSQELIDQLDDNCHFSKFISGVTSGYVCIDQSRGTLSSFFELEYSAADPGQDL